MRQIPLFILFIVLSASAFAQSRIGYYYDEGGNRVRREIVLAPEKMQRETPHSTMFSDKIGKQSVKIYPNPTAGQLKVEIAGLEKSDNCRVNVYSSAGILLVTTNINGGVADIDISGHVAGVYLMTIIINDETTTWRIIKK